MPLQSPELAQQNERLLRAALLYAAAGIPVVHCGRFSKKPDVGRGGLHKATTDPALITKWWTEKPLGNIGLRTGVKFDVCDLDTHGQPLPDASTAVLAKAFAHEDTVIVQSPHGWHYYVQPTGRDSVSGAIPNRRILPSVDWRGRNGIIIAPPSITHDGEYKVFKGSILGGELPDAGPLIKSQLDELLPSRRTQTAANNFYTGQGGTAYGIVALNGWLSVLADTAEHARNNTLNDASFQLHQLVPSGHLDQVTIELELERVAAEIGLDENEIMPTIRSGGRAGMQNPREAKRKPLTSENARLLELIGRRQIEAILLHPKGEGVRLIGAEPDNDLQSSVAQLVSWRLVERGPSRNNRSPYMLTQAGRQALKSNEVPTQREAIELNRMEPAISLTTQGLQMAGISDN